MSLGDIFNFAFQAFERRISEISEIKTMKHLVMFYGHIFGDIQLLASLNLVLGSINFLLIQSTTSLGRL